MSNTSFDIPLPDGTVLSLSREITYERRERTVTIHLYTKNGNTLRWLERQNFSVRQDTRHLNEYHLESSFLYNGRLLSSPVAALFMPEDIAKATANVLRESP